MSPSIHAWPLTMSMVDMSVPLYTCMTTHCVYGRHVCPPLYMHGHSQCLWKTCMSPSIHAWPLTVSMVDMSLPLYTCMTTHCVYGTHVCHPLYMHGHSQCLWKTCMSPSIHAWPLTVSMVDMSVPFYTFMATHYVYGRHFCPLLHIHDHIIV